MKINKRLLPIKTHYFLQYAGASFMTMVLPLIVKHKGISPQGIGIIFTAMPIIGLLVNSVSGTWADYRRGHRIIFLFAIASLTFGLITVYFIPDIPSVSIPQPLEIMATAIPENMIQMENTESLSSRNNTEVKEMNQNENVSHSKEFVGKRLRDHDVPTMPSSLGHEHIIGGNKDIGILGIAPELAVEEGEIFLPFNVPLRNLEKRSANNVNESSTNQDKILSLVEYPEFWLIFLSVMGTHVGLNLCIMMADTVCFLILGPDSHKYGVQRLWGTLGMGLMAITVGAIVDAYSAGLPGPDYFPAVIICGVLMTLDFSVVARMNIPYARNAKLKMGDVGSVIKRPEVILFLVAVYVISTSLGVLWVFKMIMIEDVANAWDSNFQNLKLLQGLDLGIETFGGEMPFFFLSGTIIHKLGHSAVLSISLASMGVRCCLYYFVSNPWWFLPVELLNGLSYGLFHAVMASYASFVAPPGAQATLQAITRAGFSIGLSTAGLVGGILYHSLGGGGMMYMMVGLFNFGFCFLYTILSVVIDRYCNGPKVSGRNKYEAAATDPSAGADCTTILDPSEGNLPACQLMLSHV